MGSPAVSYEISFHRKRIPQNNSLALWRPRFLLTISFGSFSNSITFVCETSTGWTGFVNETFKISPTNDIHNFEDVVSNWNLNRPHYNMKNIIRPSVCDKISRFPSVWNHLRRLSHLSVVSSFSYIVRRNVAVTYASTLCLCNVRGCLAHLHCPTVNISNVDASTERKEPAFFPVVL